MSNDTSVAEQVADTPEIEINEHRVAEYLRNHPDFFMNQGELLADLSLPHESGKAISLLERQVAILRSRGIESRQKLNNLLENARNNDQLFDTTRNLILALLRADSIVEVANVTQDQLSDNINLDACEIILIDHPSLIVPQSLRKESVAALKTNFSDVFRLKRTHCGQLDKAQITYLFPSAINTIRSTALCPVINNGEVLAMLAFGNRTANYFNINLDTIFLDFMGLVIGAVLNRHLGEVGR